MAINFKDSPNTGDTETHNNVLYTFDGSKWTANNTSTTDTRYVNVTGDTMKFKH